jgi:hypothetical protein
MFDIYCHRHQSRVLLGPRSIERLENTPSGVVLHWRCRCGAHGTEAFGRSVPAHLPVDAARDTAA